MMQITLDVQDLKTLIDGLNNSMIAYNDVVVAITWCCELQSSKLEPLKQVPFETLRERQQALKDVYNQLIQIEQTIEKNKLDCIKKE